MKQLVNEMDGGESTLPAGMDVAGLPKLADVVLG